MLDEGIDAAVLGAQDLLGRLRAGKHGVLGEVLEVSAAKGRAVDVDRRRVPTRNLQLVGHVADRLAVLAGQVLVPRARQRHVTGQANRAHAGEVVLQGRGAVDVGQADLANGVRRRVGVAAVGDEVVHVVNGQFVEKIAPLLVVIVNAAQVIEAQAVVGAGGGHLVIGVVELGGVVVAVVVVGGLVLVGHAVVGGGGSGLGIVGKAVGTREVRQAAVDVVKGVGSRHGVTVVSVVVRVVGHGLGNAHGLRSNLVVAVGVDRDLVVACLKHVGLGVLVVVRGQLVVLEANLDGLGLTRLQQLGLLIGNKIGRGLLDAAVGVRRVGVDLNNVLAGHAAGVGHGDVKAHGAVGVARGAHLLREGRIRQAVAKRVLHGCAVVDQILVGCGLVEAIAHVDALVVVDKAGRAGAAGALDLELLDVVVGKVAKVVPAGRGRQVIDKSIGRLTRGVGLAAKDAAQGLKTGLAGVRSPHDTLDLRVVVNKAHLKGVGAVIDNHDVVKVGAHQVKHVALGLVKLQVVLALGKVIVIGRVVVIGNVGRLHVSGQVKALAAHAANDHDGGRRVGAGVVDKLLAVGCGRGLGQGPVGGGDADLAAGCAVAVVEIGELLVGAKAGHVKSVKKRHRIVGV